MFQVSIICPEYDNSGFHNGEHIDSIKRHLAKQYGGFSSTSLDGGWYDQETGQYFEDHSKMVWTFVQSQEQVDAIKEQSSNWAIDLGQIELLVCVFPLDCHFVPGIARKQKAA